MPPSNVEVAVEVLVIAPESDSDESVPTDVKDEETTVVPSVVPERMLVEPMMRPAPLARFNVPAESERPLLKVEVAVEVRLIDPPVMESPFDEERPATESAFENVEVAFRVRLMKAAELPIEKTVPGEVVPMPTLPLESMTKAVEVALAVEVE